MLNSKNICLFSLLIKYRHLPIYNIKKYPQYLAILPMVELKKDVDMSSKDTNILINK